MTSLRDTVAHTEFHDTAARAKLNWLRAAVLGANDGIVSVSSVIVGVAGASNSSGFILTAGIAALVAGALSMAVGEYVSVSTQRDTEKALLEKERWELENAPESELKELVEIYEKKGLSKQKN
jgi:VIT1/CCC1 family predicted Fe2+/Mn2+ transporter